MTNLNQKVNEWGSNEIFGKTPIFEYIVAYYDPR